MPQSSLRTEPHSAAPASVVVVMESALREVEREVEATDYWRALIDEETPKEQILAFMREVMLEIWSYQKRVDEAVFAAVGRLGTSIDEQGLIRTMIAVQIEETGHGSMALQDYCALGGDEQWARERRPSPAARALISVVKNLGEAEHPLCHLGYMYFFEKFTTMMTEKVSPYLERAGYPQDRLEFMRLHAEEDIRHADMLANVIVECESRYPDAAEHVRYGFDCFREIYPHALWSTAYQRSQGAR